MEIPLSARAALLQALVFPGYGLELIDRIRRSTGGLVRLRMGSVYPALKALDDEGLVRCQAIPPGAGAGRPRKYYELTARGVAAASSEREALAGLCRARASQTTREDRLRMRERLHRCARVSGSVQTLRGRMLALQGRR